MIHDITERKRTEKERNSLQKQLMQAQKLESIGRLAGGVAHDFNNMLNVIIGYGELILGKLQPGDPMQEDVEAIVKAGHRSAVLTRQLLAFSRKQTLQAKEIYLNDLVRNIEKMIRRLIGEDIELKIVLAQDIGRIFVDPGQIDQVIMNLVVNARDAMPTGGKLLIETVAVDLDKTYAEKHPSVKPGKYVLLAVTDTGCGMNTEILNLIFDPFFTTKKEGQGTGLGLSTVYGIVKQFGGYIWVDSEPGQGTTFKIYLPQNETKQEVVSKKCKKVDRSVDGDKHILLVEDEESLRKLMKSILSRLGFKVTSVADGKEALLLVEEKGLKPDLILTDMVMPNMSGKELVDCLRKNCPDLKVLYMSGYTANAIVHEEVIDHSSPFIQKPFTIDDIKAKIRNVLNSDNQ
jgi:nitrogen-specific signal transduction histidine kinase/CheY-like chemotaxis protein